MTTTVFRYDFANAADATEAEATLQLAILAAEGLYGEARVRLEASYFVDAPRPTIVVDGTTVVGDAVVRIYTGFLTREIGPDAFTVRRIPTARPPAAHSGVAA